MSVVADITTIVFDYGNTLIPFSHDEVEKQHEALAAALRRHYGHVDMDRLTRIRGADRIQPYSNELRENDLPELCINLVQQLYGVEPSAEALDDLLTARFTSFVEAIELPEGIRPMLEQLAARYELGVLSNYPDGNAVRASMDRIGILPLFAHVVVSGDIGYIKPHPIPFEQVVRLHNVSPPSVLFVGDNWLADVQGAKRIGMMAALVTQYAPIDSFEPEEGDYDPDFVIERIDELPGLLTA